MTETNRKKILAKLKKAYGLIEQAVDEIDNAELINQKEIIGYCGSDDLPESVSDIAQDLLLELEEAQTKITNQD